MIPNSDNCHQICNEVIRIRDAVIEEIHMEQRISLVTVSYIEVSNRRRIRQSIRLVVNAKTIIRNERGQRVSVRGLRVGMTVHAVVSSAMTKSIPPQTNAYLITVIDNAN